MHLTKTNIIKYKIQKINCNTIKYRIKNYRNILIIINRNMINYNKIMNNYQSNIIIII